MLWFWLAPVFTFSSACSFFCCSASSCACLSWICFLHDKKKELLSKDAVRFDLLLCLILDSGSLRFNAHASALTSHPGSGQRMLCQLFSRFTCIAQCAFFDCIKGEVELTLQAHCQPAVEQAHPHFGLMCWPGGPLPQWLSAHEPALPPSSSFAYPYLFQCARSLLPPTQSHLLIAKQLGDPLCKSLGLVLSAHELGAQILVIYFRQALYLETEVEHITSTPVITCLAAACSACSNCRFSCSFLSLSAKWEFCAARFALAGSTSASLL